MNVIISNPQNLEKLKSGIKKSGLNSLHILSDFDKTLTYGQVDGVKTPSIISMLRDGRHLSENYADEDQALFDKYHPLETALGISREEKKKSMQGWWETHNRLLIKSGLSKSDLEDIVNNGPVKFRDGLPEFLDFLYEHNIPLVILSASGCGDAIQLFFKKINRDYPNVFYLTNKFNWDEKGRVISIKGPVIHSLNKDETILEKIPKIYKTIKDRKNVILLGDNIEDIKMITGFNYANLLKIGFLNSDDEKIKEAYKKNFDVIITGDGDFNFINNLIQSLS